MSNSLNIEYFGAEKKIAIIKLMPKVLGGNDAMEFTSELNTIINDSLKTVIVDFSEVEVINSTGLGMLVSAHTTLKKTNKEFIICNVPEKVTNLLEMTHLDKVFNIKENTTEALNYAG